MLELYIFNKESNNKDGLSSWDDTEQEAITNTLIYNLDRFKFKDSSVHIFPELAQELNQYYKENDQLKKFFEKFSSSSIQIKVQENYHHLLGYDTDSQALILDFKVQSKLIPLYLFAIYYAFARKNLDEDAVYKDLPEFLLSFDIQVLENLTHLFERDKKGPRVYDAGGHLQIYLNELLKFKKNQSNTDPYLLTQLLRNRTIAGKLPYDIHAFEKILEKHNEDQFSGEANEQLFQAVKESFDEDFARKYYRHLGHSLKQLGFGVVAQRGSRVAHEQGPILINSGSVLLSAEFAIKTKKLRSTITESVSKIEEILSKTCPDTLNNKISKIVLNIDLSISSLIYFCELQTVAKSRIEKTISDLKTSFRNLFSTLQNEMDSKLYWTIYDQIQNLTKNTLQAVLELEDELNATPITKKKSVIYVQRPSSRSGHFLPRILLGLNLYIETDKESENQRLKAIPYNFVSPEFFYVADNIEAFFENASISIVTDRKTGNPYIKWENAEDLAISLAPGMFKAIKASQDNGRNFQYQLETTLFGPLIELFMVLLETEMSNIATIEKHNLYKSSQLTISDLQNIESGFDIVSRNQDLENILNSYVEEVLEAAQFIFAYYLLEDALEEYKLAEGLTESKAIFEMILSLRDIQLDVARYCLLKRKNPKKFQEFKTWAEEELNKSASAKSAKEKKETIVNISERLAGEISGTEAKYFIKKYIRYPESTARKEYLESNPSIQRVTVSSDKTIKEADYLFDFTVAPSRIDFGKHVVASVTTLMGRILGANDLESLEKGKEYIDLVSKTNNNFFSSASEAGSVKVIENTCRALQYSKAIAFQGAYQSFGIDGMQARMTVNSRNTREAGIHVMEYGTMASTGYCITKEPLFILLAYSINSDSLLEKLGIEKTEIKEEFKTFFGDLVKSRASFANAIDWQLSAYEEISNSALVQKYLSDPEYSWLPNLKSVITLLKYLSDEGSEEELASKSYSLLASKLIEIGRVVNETGIIQRTQIMNSAIRRAMIQQDSPKDYSDLVIAFNASYKGNVSDERENANQYLIALLLHQKEYLKNASIPEVEKLFENQMTKYSLPKEIRVYDPFVDKDLFMGGELKVRAEDLINKLSSLDFKAPLTKEIIEAAIVSYGSDFNSWTVLQKRFKDLDTTKVDQVKSKLESLKADFKYLELYCKGFYKDHRLAYQGVDVIQLNSDHDDLIEMVKDLSLVKNIMRINNENSLLVLVDNPQQAKKPFLDYDRTLEWIALGGTICSHMISEEKYEEWKREINNYQRWAKLYLQKLIFDKNYGQEELANNPDYQKSTRELKKIFEQWQQRADLNRDLLYQKYLEAQDLSIDQNILKRYIEWIACLARLKDYASFDELDFADWLILGGRWLLNGQEQKDISFAIELFESRKNFVSKFNKKTHDILNLFVKAYELPDIERKDRILKNAGSTKEGDLLVSSAGDSFEIRARESSKVKTYLARKKEFQNFDSRIKASIDVNNFEDLENFWESNIQEFIQLLKSSRADINDLHKSFAKLLKLLEQYSNKFVDLDPELNTISHNFINIKKPDAFDLIPIFGDHRASGGIFQKLADKISQTSSEAELLLDKLAKLGEIFNTCFLIFLLIGVDDENEIINNLGIFFDQYLNVHEEDYPPYMFHSICAGSSFGFNQTYYLDTNLRTKMFKLACKTGVYIYKLLHFALANKSILKYTSQEYRDAVIGDYENGIIPIGYQHETICIEERLWDCMKSLRNFVRNYHDRHPLPIIIKGNDATVEKLFRYKLDKDIDLCWIAGISNIGKHSWDLNCVLRSPLLRSKICTDSSGQQYINISIFTPYLTNNGEIKQIYTSFSQGLIEEQSINYIAPFKSDFAHPKYDLKLEKGFQGAYQLNAEGFVHSLVLLNANSKSLPTPNVTMSAHTHPQYISNFVRDLGVPETWSMLSMLQMYSKTEVPKILAEVGMESLAQIDFTQKEFESKAQVREALIQRLQERNYDHIDFWILKASKESGGRGISSRLSITKDLNQFVDFIFLKTRTDDVVMQEFVPNNAKAFINPDFANNIKDTFIESGLAIDQITPYEQIYFAMRSFQSINGIKGYLFSVNIGSVTVNAGQGAKLFYGEPIYIMPIYIAGKIQALLDEQGELILKEAIPKHAEKFARANHLSIVNNNLGTTNCYMFNGLFDYIPYAFVERADPNGSSRKFKVICEENVQGGLDYYYNYFGEMITLCSGLSHVESLKAFEQILKDSSSGELKGPETIVDIDLAKIEFNSGLGQANLLQKAIEAMAPENKDLFLEWTMDLGTIGMAAKTKAKS